MKYVLSNFYKSDRWQQLTRIIRLDRTDKDGHIICAYCGEPIVKAYDCICHHVIPLNENNVNDAEIALNPDNILLVHHKCHNRIHNKFRTDEAVRQVYLVYGPPLAGKTTWVNQVQNKGDLIVDMDNIWQCISGLDRYQKPRRLNSCVFGMRDYLLECVRYRRGKWLNAYVVGGYPLISERERLCNALGAREVFIDTAKEECLKRLNDCSDGRDKDEWERFIDDWWDRYPPGTS